MAELQLRQLRGPQGIAALAVTVVMLGFGLVLALTRLPWAWLLVPVPAMMIAVWLWLPRHLRRRIELLRDEPPYGGAS
ncbi:MAG: hypothetical protein M3P48_05115 [Actinomycetota bacterium]|nr:hypothetical protein [Actinomycetota bacterium]